MNELALRNARRGFVAVWVVLGVMGALNHTIARSAFGRTFDLVLPHLKYGHVMFNKNPRTIRVYEYEGPDGVRHGLADLSVVPAPGYGTARVALDIMTQPDYLPELCLRAFRRTNTELTIIGTEWEVGVGEAHPARTLTLRCGAHGLVAR